jgi:hypothetical protein
MQSPVKSDVFMPDLLTGERLLLKLGGSHFIVQVLSCDFETMRISFPGADFPLDDTWLHLEMHDDEGVTAFRARVLEGSKSRGAGLVLEYPAETRRRLHRDAFRVPTDLTAQVRGETHSKRYSAEVVNLSSSGALLQVDAPLAEESTVGLLLAIPRERRCQLSGEIVHSRWRRLSPLTVKGLFGVRFVDAPEPTRESLSHYVGERLRHLSSID